MTESRTPETPAAAPLDAAAVLRWYVAAGVDIAVGETPVDRTAAPAAAPQPQPQAAPHAAMTAAPRAAAAVPEGAATLEALRALVEGFDGCLLRRTATRTVFGNGPEDARLMVVGEAPGADEDRSGVPFVGKAGQLLDKMLASIGWPRAAVYVTNVVPWRPPGNRNPTPEEITLCLPFVLRAIDLIAPRAILLLGASSAGALLGSHEGITRMRGRWHTLARPGLEIPALPTFHPAFLLRNPASKALVWRDLLDLQARIGTADTPQK